MDNTGKHSCGSYSFCHMSDRSGNTGYTRNVKKTGTDYNTGRRY